MTLRNEITKDLKSAMKDRDKERLSVLRSLDSMIKNEEIAQGKREEGLDDEQSINIIKRAIKQRKDSAKQYYDGGRDDLAQKEESEIKIIEKYLPEQMSEDEIQTIVKEVIEQVGAQNKSDMGKVMGMVMQRVGQDADGGIVRKIVESQLS